jgi:hypothetical protein
VGKVFTIGDDGDYDSFVFPNTAGLTALSITSVAAVNSAITPFVSSVSTLTAADVSTTIRLTGTVDDYEIGGNAFTFTDHDGTPTPNPANTTGIQDKWIIEVIGGGTNIPGNAHVTQASKVTVSSDIAFSTGIITIAANDSPSAISSALWSGILVTGGGYGVTSGTGYVTIQQTGPTYAAATIAPTATIGAP